MGNESFLLHLISLTEVKGLPSRPHVQFISEFGIRSGNSYEAAKNQVYAKQKCKPSQPASSLVCDPSCSATSQIAAQQALSEQKDQILFILPSQQ